MQVARWGTSLAVRLPASVVEALQLKEGDDIEIRASDRTHFELARRPTIEELIESVRTLRGSLPKDFKFDRDEANAR